jgi:hypothetical protein
MSNWLKYLHRYQIYSSLVSKLIFAGSRVTRRLFLFGRKILVGLNGTTISDDQFQKALRSEFSRIEDLLKSFKEYQSRLFFIQPQNSEEKVNTLLQICPESQGRIVQAADTICEHTFDLLGSGPTNLSWPIDWHADFKTGHRWDPRQYYAEVCPAPYPGGYDLKIPWELSRCQHFPWLGQAYWLTRNEKYTYEFRTEVEDWIRQNKPEYGVNWACSMDIAIRAVNWLWGYAFFQSSPVLDDRFRLALYKSLLCHGRHIRANLEWTATFTGNHYLSDIVGLIYLGILLPELKEAQSWREFGLKELEREMFKQVYPDGGNFESSTSYHRLVTELFLSATLLAIWNGYKFSEAYLNRLEKMLDLIFQITRPDGTVPVIGDQDNGRLHRLKVWENPDEEWKDFRGLLALGSILFDKPEWGKAAGNQWEEAVWFYGMQAFEALQKSSQLSPPQMESKEFKDAGIYILRADDIFVAVDVGPIGQNGKGGHAHNDSLSFELFSDDQTWIQDPGTYLYTADYEARNLFRSTVFHNTLAMPGYEQNGYDTLKLFSLKNESLPQVLSWRTESDSESWLIGEVQRLRSPNIVHRRSFHLCGRNRALLLTDVVHNPISTCELLFHFAPGLQPELVEKPYSGVKLINGAGKIAWLFSASLAGVKIQLQKGWIAEGYGKRVPAWVVSIKLESVEKHCSIFLLPGEADISRRIANVIKDEDHDH